MSDENEEIAIDATSDKDNGADSKKDAEIVILDDDEAISEKDPAKALKKLEKKLKKEKEARREAEERARLASFHAQKANVEVEDTHLHLVNNAIETLKRDTEILTANYAEAMRSGDYETGARIQSTINQYENNLKELHEGQLRMQTEARNKPPLPPEPPKVLRPEDRVNEIISQVSKPSQQWLKANRDHLSDERSINKMFRAHADAVEDGIQPDTNEYFRYIEGRLGINQDDNRGSPMSSASKSSSRQAPPPSAPVNRESNGKNNAAHLTRAESDMAKTLGLTERQYWDNKMALKKEGRLN